MAGCAARAGDPGQGCEVGIRRLSKAQTGNAFGWYDIGRREVQLYAGLAGVNLGVVALHEFTHALHHAHRLGRSGAHRDFVRVQCHGWLAIVRDNPALWRWLAWALSHPEQARLDPQ